MNSVNLTLSNYSHNTVKVPDFILLKESRKEIEELKKRIAELEGDKEKQALQIKYLTSGENIQAELEIRRNVKKEEMYKTQREEMNRINKSIRKYKLSNEQLICENIQLKNKLNTL